jgi:alginate O-acetyltransferase complex protein AlgI
MNFNTLEFLLLFLPLILAVYHLLPGKMRLGFILLASLFFYGVSGLIPMYFMVASVAWGFFTALLFRRMSTKVATVISVSGPLAALFLFKYLNFAIETVGGSAELYDTFEFFLAVTLPAGISFYTFQILSYSLDVGDDTVPRERSFVKLATYICFFPQLIAGPIVRYGQINKQLDRVATERWLKVDVVTGMKFLSFGLFGKIFFADILGMLHKNHYVVDFLAVGTPLDAAFLCLAYSFQIYFDFWAYSIMAVGLAKLFGIDLPINFREPYMSLNPREFWRRWHITLSYWLRDYVYIRLGGNKNYTRNIFVVFAIVGLWHGAGWNFIVWGLYHALLVVGYTLTRQWWDRVPAAIQISVTFLMVSFGWPLFFADIYEYGHILLKMVGHYGTGEGIYGIRHWAYLSIVAAWTFFVRESYWLYNTGRHWLFDSPLTHSATLFTALIFVSLSSTFIYFRF